MFRRSIPAIGAAIAILALAAATALAAVSASNGSSVTAVVKVTPTKLSKKKPTPIKMRISTKIAAVDPAEPDADPIAKETIDFDKNGTLTTKGLPTCNPKLIEQRSESEAIKKCGDAMIGDGMAKGVVVTRDEDGRPFPPSPFEAKITAFNGIPKGHRPTILLLGFMERPVPGSYLISGTITPYHKHGFGTRLAIDFPTLFGGAGALQDFYVDIGATYRYKGKKHSVLNAKCPGSRKLKAEVTVTFKSGAKAGVPMTSGCKPRG